MHILTDRVAGALPALGLAAGAAIEVISRHPRWIVRLATGDFLVDTERGPRLSDLLRDLPVEERPVTVVAARCAERFDRAARLLGDNAGEAFDLAQDALIELDHLAPLAVGHGALPRVDAVDFDGVARLIRAGESALARSLAVDGVSRLAGRLERTPAVRSVERSPDVLDGWFAEAPEAVEAACAALAERSLDRVERPDTFNSHTGLPGRGGAHCAVIFGAVRQSTCLCGQAHPAGERCPRCGVEVGSLAARDTRFACIELPQGVVHPALTQAAAACVDHTPTALRRMLRCDPDDAEVEGDDEAVIQMLARLDTRAPSLLVTRVPVTPPGDRPLTLVPGDAGAFATLMHPADMALLRVCNRAHRLRRLLDLDAPEVIVRYERLRLQGAVTRWYDTVRAATGPTRLRAPEALQIVPLEPDWADPPLEPAVAALLWTDAEHLLVQVGTRVHRVHWATGADAARWTGDQRLPRFAHAGRLGCVGQYPHVTHPEAALGDLVARRATDGATLPAWPADLPCAFVEKHQPEDGTLVLPTVEHYEDAWPASDRPGALAWSNDGGTLWVGDPGGEGALVQVRTAARRRVLLADPPIRALTAGGALIDDPDEEHASWGTPAVHASTVVTLLQPDGACSVGGEARWRLGFEWTAAAFSPDGRRLAVGTGDGDVVIIDVGDARVLRRLHR